MSAPNGSVVKYVKTKRYCSVPQCKNKASGGISLHYFPKQLALRRKWVIACRIGKAFGDYMAVCSAHFEERDFFPNVAGNERRCLKATAVPTLLLPRRSVDCIPNLQIEAARSRRDGVESRNLQQTCSNSAPCISQTGIPSTLCDTLENSDCDSVVLPTSLQEGDGKVSVRARIRAVEAFLKFKNMPIIDTERFKKSFQVCKYLVTESEIGILDLIKTYQEMSAFRCVTMRTFRNLVEAVCLYEKRSNRKASRRKHRVAMTLLQAVPGY